MSRARALGTGARPQEMPRQDSTPWPPAVQCPPEPSWGPATAGTWAFTEPALKALCEHGLGGQGTCLQAHASSVPVALAAKRTGLFLVVQSPLPNLVPLCSLF